ncbi:hypothetical protein T484DRAFT_1906251 [Baffinella frigidus]|nr:hypothetical protein T484DRAFT_1906251 [Cryptophyta sp. CCMP2293]
MPPLQSGTPVYARRHTHEPPHREDPAFHCAPARRPRGGGRWAMTLVGAVLFGSLPRCSLLEAPAAACAPGEHARWSGLASSRHLNAPCFISPSSGRIGPGAAELGRRTIKQDTDPHEGMVKGYGTLASRLAALCTNIACSPRHKPRHVPALLELRGGGRPPQIASPK